MNEKNGLASTPDFSKWWSKKQTMFGASSDAARRYYSVKEYLKHDRWFSAVQYMQGAVFSYQLITREDREYRI
jgi:hypothetical protein